MEYFLKFPIIKNAVAKNLKNPSKGPVGWYLSNVFFKAATIFTRNAIKNCNIQANDKVLELGSGPGYGLLLAAKCVKDGHGKVHGLDISDYMVKVSTERCQDLIDNGKVEIIKGSVENMPFGDSSIDRVYHANCYYFWPDMDKAVREIRRVMKPGSEMVAALHLDKLKEIKSEGFFKYGDIDPERYIKSLKDNGFDNVKMENVKDRGICFQLIFSKLNSNKHLLKKDSNA